MCGAHVRVKYCILYIKFLFFTHTKKILHEKKIKLNDILCQVKIYTNFWYDVRRKVFNTYVIRTSNIFNTGNIYFVQKNK